MKTIVFLAQIVLSLGFLASCSNKDKSEVFLSNLMGASPYQVVDFKIGNEGVMGDLYRSWIIELPENYVDVNSVWSSWREARPLLTESEIVNIFREHHSSFFEILKNEEMQIEQRAVPEGVLDFRGLATIRIVFIDESKRYMFVFLERY